MAGSIREKIQLAVGPADTLQRLLMINVVVFLVIRIINSVSELFLNPVLELFTVLEWLAVPADLSVLLHKPWSLFTYMFLHWDFMHLLFNMLWLFWMGKIFQEYLGNRKLLAVYILGGISGAFVFIAAYNIFPLFSTSLGIATALGASASVLAITVAAATLVPDYPIQLLFFGRVALKWVAACTLLLDLISISGDNAGGHLAHLGGALFGFLYIRQMRAGRDIGEWFSRIADKFSVKRKARMQVKYSRAASDEDYLVSKKGKQERLDEILDKISKSGYGSLSKEEREFLFNQSKDN